MLKNDLIDLMVEGIEVEGVYFMNKYGVPMGVAHDMIVNIKVNDVLHELEARAMRQSWALVGHLRPNSSSDNYKGSNNYDYTSNIRAYWLNPNKQALKEYFNRFNKKELQKIMIFTDKAKNGRFILDLNM